MSLCPVFGSRDGTARHLLDVHRILVHHVPWILTDTLPELAHGLGGWDLVQFYGDLDGLHHVIYRYIYIYTYICVCMHVCVCEIYIYILLIWIGVPFFFFSLYPDLSYVKKLVSLASRVHWHARPRWVTDIGCTFKHLRPSRGNITGWCPKLLGQTSSCCG